MPFSAVQLSIVSVSLMALSSPADLSITTALGVLQAIIPALFMNVCIVGFNQLCDVDIDKVRACAATGPPCVRPRRRCSSRRLLRQVTKPYLPLASGDFSLALGQTLVVLCGAIALALGACASQASSAVRRPAAVVSDAYRALQATSPTRRR